jgi:predicted N-formylglutamate amidohydrolase
MDHTPFTILNRAGSSDIVITCDHASNVVPSHFAGLGLDAAALNQHIAWDIGAAGVARILAQEMDCPAILCGTSRLVVDCNRHPHDPKAMPEVSDHIVIPGNQSLSATAKQERIERYFRPYHDAVASVIEERVSAGQQPLILSVHSMTPAMNGVFRPWQISFSSNAERAMSDRILAILRQRSDITVGDNQPYDMDPAEDYSTPLHALARKLPYLQVEFRQDVVGDDEGVARWAAIFSAALKQLRKAV